MPVTTGYSRSGVPDFVACCNGVFVGIETKSKFSSHTVTALQEKNLQSIASAGGVALEINEDNIEKLVEYLSGIEATISEDGEVKAISNFYIKLNKQ